MLFQIELKTVDDGMPGNRAGIGSLPKRIEERKTEERGRLKRGEEGGKKDLMRLRYT